MRTRPQALVLLALLLSLPAQAALTPVGAPLEIANPDNCSFTKEVEVTATPAGAFEVVWVDDGDDFAVKGQRFARNLRPTGPPLSLLPLHGGLNVADVLGTWTNRYEFAFNALDTGDFPDDPLQAYRLSLGVEGEPLASAVRRRAADFAKLAPASNGDSLLFRAEPPLFGPPSCRSEGLVVRRIDRNGQPLSADSRITRKGAGWTLNHLVVDRLVNDTFVAVYDTCDGFLGLVARRLNAAGAPVSNPINLPLPGRVGNFAGGDLVLAARTAGNFAVAAMVLDTANPSVTGGYVQAVVNARFPPAVRIPIPAGVTGIGGVVDLAVSPAGRYLLLFQGVGGSPERQILFAQEFNDEGRPQGAARAVTAEGKFASSGSVASLPNGRWLVVAREQRSPGGPNCRERLFGMVYKGN